MASVYNARGEKRVLYIARETLYAVENKNEHGMSARSEKLRSKKTARCSRAGNGCMVLDPPPRPFYVDYASRLNFDPRKEIHSWQRSRQAGTLGR